MIATDKPCESTGDSPGRGGGLIEENREAQFQSIDYKMDNSVSLDR